jgi:AraC-like DNA-binding protein
LWASSAPASVPVQDPYFNHELILPTGMAHLAFRLDNPVVLTTDHTRYPIGRAVVGGPRSAAYRKEISPPSRSVGVQFHPGALPHLFQLPASEVAERHVSLEQLLDRRTQERLLDQLDAGNCEQQLTVVEDFLLTLVPTNAAIHPAIMAALRETNHDSKISEIVAKSGYSHRHLNALFRTHIGFTPKRWERVQRFDRVVHQLHNATALSLSALAQSVGYADQAHLTREFREMAGISPTTYVKNRPTSMRHVVLPVSTPKVRILQDTPPKQPHNARSFSHGAIYEDP